MQDFIWTAILILSAIAGAGIISWAKCERRKQKARQKSSDTVDLTGINFERCSEAEFEEKVRELREITEGGREKDEIQNSKTGI
jgi:hypothetical protein